jgi:hypothetical protein
VAHGFGPPSRGARRAFGGRGARGPAPGRSCGTGARRGRWECPGSVTPTRAAGAARRCRPSPSAGPFGLHGCATGRAPRARPQAARWSAGRGCPSDRRTSGGPGSWRRRRQRPARRSDREAAPATAPPRPDSPPGWRPGSGSLLIATTSKTVTTVPHPPPRLPMSIDVMSPSYSSASATQQWWWTCIANAARGRVARCAGGPASTIWPSRLGEPPALRQDCRSDPGRGPRRAG